MRSMTAYAAAYKAKDSQAVQIILRSLNFKYLDISVRNLPVEDILLEEAIKKEIQKRVFRGRIEVFILFAQAQSKKIYVDERAVASYISQIKALAKKYNAKAEVKIGDILSLPQVISWEQRGKRRQTLILPTLKDAVEKLVKFKKKKGEAIKREIMKNLNKLGINVRKIKKGKPKISSMENGKEDIDEELSLISFYVTKLGSKINIGKAEPKGKAIDFLTQEILRELNAASSKTRKKEPALLIVEAKNYLERIREQAQNIE